MQGFKTPSGNIGCYVTAELARCDIEQRAFSATPKPADCEGDWGSGAVSVEATRPGNFVCASDTVRDPNAPVLGYGQRTRQASFVCDSAEVGVTCTNEATGHGFFLSRERYRFF